MRFQSIVLSVVASTLATHPLLSFSAVQPASLAASSQEIAQAGLFLAQSGEGTFSLAGRPDATVTFTSVTLQNQGAELAFRLLDDRLMRFGGEVMRRDASEVVIRLRNSGMADARGTVTIAYDGTAIASVSADGRLDGQP
ncbi:MAG: hypothetical protein F6K03_05580, partial [Kamptonema sp. SIO4C4]|nr:hypothetical protein [Kamptonema sp. SIO4C4]